MILSSYRWLVFVIEMECVFCVGEPKFLKLHIESLRDARRCELLTWVTRIVPAPGFTEVYRSCWREEGVAVLFWPKWVEVRVVCAPECNVDICECRYLPKAKFRNRCPGCKSLLQNCIYMWRLQVRWIPEDPVGQLLLTPRYSLK